MMRLYDEDAGKQECAMCGEPIYRYCHSQAGPIKAYAWTVYGPEDEEDPRYGTRCEYASIGLHRVDD